MTDIDNNLKIHPFCECICVSTFNEFCTCANYPSLCEKAIEQNKEFAELHFEMTKGCAVRSQVRDKLIEALDKTYFSNVYMDFEKGFKYLLKYKKLHPNPEKIFKNE